MKKVGFVIKLISSIAIIVIGIIIMTSKPYLGYYNGKSTSYKYYSSDAYTGIQNAAADTAKNVASLGVFIQSALTTAVNTTYTFAGILIAVVGVYMLGTTFSDVKSKEKSKAVVGAPVVATNHEDAITTLTKFKELLDAGAITEEEFDAKKKELLNI